MKNFQLIKPKELAARLCVSVATLYRWEAEGNLPVKKYKVGPNAVGFKESEVAEWLENSEVEQKVTA